MFVLSTRRLVCASAFIAASLLLAGCNTTSDAALAPLITHDSSVSPDSASGDDTTDSSTESAKSDLEKADSEAAAAFEALNDRLFSEDYLDDLFSFDGPYGDGGQHAGDDYNAYSGYGNGNGNDYDDSNYDYGSSNSWATSSDDEAMAQYRSFLTELENATNLSEFEVMFMAAAAQELENTGESFASLEGKSYGLKNTAGAKGPAGFDASDVLTAPQRPAFTHSAQGGAEFIDYFTTAMDYALGSTNVKPLIEVSAPSCQDCVSLVQGMQSLTQLTQSDVAVHNTRSVVHPAGKIRLEFARNNFMVFHGPGTLDQYLTTMSTEPNGVRAVKWNHFTGSSEPIEVTYILYYSDGWHLAHFGPAQ